MPQPDHDLFLAVLIVLLGAPMGSFAALLADRLPRGRPVIVTRSQCESCQSVLRWHHLIPILSWIALRGRCATCNAHIPARLLQAELAGLGLAVLAVWAGLGVLGAAIFWCLLALILSDLRFFRLPDALTVALLLLALAAAYWPDGPGEITRPDALLRAALGGAVGAGAFWALAAGYAVLRGHAGMGIGDIRLMAGLGALIVPVADWHGLALMTLIAGLSGILLGVTSSLLRGKSLRRTLRLPFGACLCGAAIMIYTASGLTLL
ncbi:MAG: prepilin peptidase [Roseinatronobacter sp.]